MSGSIKGKALIGLRILFGLAFAAAGLMKLIGKPMMVAEFDIVGLGQWFRYVTGGIEIVGALLLIRPRSVLYGACLLFCVAIGAGIAQLTRLHGDVVHTVVFAALLAWIAYEYRVRVQLHR